MCLTVTSLIDINNIITGSNNVTLRKVNVKRNRFIYFFQLRFTPCKAEQPLQGMDGVTRKRSTKSIQEIYLERT